MMYVLPHWINVCCMCYLTGSMYVVCVTSLDQCMLYVLFVNLDPWGMDTCVGCTIVEYLLSTVFLLCIGPRSAISGQYVSACFLL